MIFLRVPSVSSWPRGARTALWIALLAVGTLSAAPSANLLQIQANQLDHDSVLLRLRCDSAPVSYRISRSPGNGVGLRVYLKGLRSQVPPTVPASGGLPDLLISEDVEGVQVDIPIPGVELEEVTLDGPALLLTLSVPDAPAAPPPAAGSEPVRSDRADTGYRVGPGDLLSVSVFGHEDLGKNVRILASGVINFPLLGDVLVAGMTPAEIANRLTELLAKDYVVNPQVLVGVSEYLSQPVNVIGEVHKPGKYFLKGPTRLIDMLSEAEGLTENAGSDILITRYENRPDRQETSRQIRVSTDALFAANNDTQNIALSAGDVVHVQPAPFFYIRGEVGRPGQYAVRSETTIQKAISMAGGFTQWADQKDVQIIRQSGGESKKMVVNLRKIAKGQAPDVKIEPEDVIVVTRRLL